MVAQVPRLATPFQITEMDYKTVKFELLTLIFDTLSRAPKVKLPTICRGDIISHFQQQQQQQQHGAFETKIYPDRLKEQ